MVDFILRYYYNLDDFKLQNDDYPISIECSSSFFLLYQFPDVDKIIQSFSFSKTVCYSYPFVRNCFNCFYTYYDHYYYSLINCANHYSINPFLLYSSKYPIHLQWYKEFVKNSDFFVSNYHVLKGKDLLLDESFFYYAAMIETSIYLLKDFQNYSTTGYIQHDIFSFETYHNPFHFICDTKERDFAEYLKYIFWDDSYSNIDISSLLKQGKDFFCYDLVVARLFYPNYYLSKFRDCINSFDNLVYLRQIISRTEEYEKYLSYILEEISSFYQLKRYPNLKDIF